MNKPLVVLTYPGHMLMTKVTIKSYLQFNSCCSIIVLLDDLSPLCWPTYVDDCIQLYSSLNNKIEFMLVSSILPAHTFKQNSWFRQQIVKLYLDLVINADVWLFTDGDVEYCRAIPEHKVPFSYVQPNTLTQQAQNSYVSRTLNIDNPGISVPRNLLQEDLVSQQVCLSNPPWRWMAAITLKKLREHIERIHSLSCEEYHKRHQDLLMSEWELIANFEQKILGQDIALIFYPTYPIDSDSIRAAYYCKTCYCSDSSIGREWFDNNGISVSDRIWQTISSISC